MPAAPTDPTIAILIAMTLRDRCLRVVVAGGPSPRPEKVAEAAVLAVAAAETLAAAFGGEGFPTAAEAAFGSPSEGPGAVIGALLEQFE